MYSRAATPPPLLRRRVALAVCFALGVLFGRGSAPAADAPAPACPPPAALATHATPSGVVAGEAAPRSGIAIVIATTLDEKWMADPAGPLGLRYGVGGLSRYANMHGYAFRPVFFAPSAEVGGQHAVDKRVNWNRVAAARAACARGGISWVFFTETDVWITNFGIKLEDIIAAAVAGDDSKVLVLTRDVLGNINTGSGFARCDAGGQAALAAVLAARETHASATSVRAWGDQGGFMLLAAQPEWAPRIAYAGQRAFNSYPVHVDDWVRFDEAPEDDQHFWRRGDFAIHFAGFYKGGLASFARELGTRELRVGFQDDMDVAL